MATYEEELKRVQDRYGVKLAVVAPLWIENESRKLPKSGYYDGTPFYLYLPNLHRKEFHHSNQI
jgi:hypothetical protein